MNFTKIQDIRTLFLMFLLLFSVKTSMVSAEENIPSEYKAREFLERYDTRIYRYENGKFKTDYLSEEELKRRKRESPKQFRYSVVSSLNPQDSITGLRILLRATDQLLEHPEALLAFRRGAARWEKVIRDRVTAVIDVDFGPTRWGADYPSGIIGSASSALKIVVSGDDKTGDINTIIQALKEKHPDDIQLNELYEAIPDSVPSTARNIINTDSTQDTTIAYFTIPIGGRIHLQALGLSPAETDTSLTESPFGNVPNIGFNSSMNFDFDPSDGIDSDKLDFDAVVTHEIGHSLGFITAAIPLLGGPPSNCFCPWDLFRVRPEAVESDGLEGFRTAERVITEGPADYDTLTIEDGKVYYKATHVFYDGVEIRELSSGDHYGDGNQTAHWRHYSLRPPSLGEKRYIGIMDPLLELGTRRTIGHNDLRLLEVIGYDINYEPDFSQIVISDTNGAIDISGLTDTIHMGNMELNDTLIYEFYISNTHPDIPLICETEFTLNTRQPDTAMAKIEISSLKNEINSGQTDTLQLLVHDIHDYSVFNATLRLYTNVQDRLIVEIPLFFSVGGAIAPKIQLDADSLGDLGNLAEKDVKETPFTIYNQGNLELECQLVPSVSIRSMPFETTPDSLFLSKTVPQNSPFLFSEDTSILYYNDFETNLGGLTPSGTHTEYWRITEAQAARLNGHSETHTLYFGKFFLNSEGQVDSARYPINSDTWIKTPVWDLRDSDMSDLFVLTFNHYLQAEEDYDFASVHFSIDSGKTFRTALSSETGGLINDSSWQAVMIQFPQISKNFVQFAFHFTSDYLFNKEGWYIDDMKLTKLKGQNNFYTSHQKIIVPDNENPASVSLFLNGHHFNKGFYQGNIQILSNDISNPSLNLPFHFSAGSPAYPTLSPSLASLEFSLEENQDTIFSLTINNEGDADLDFIRLLNPSSQNYHNQATNTITKKTQASNTNHLTARNMNDSAPVYSAELPASLVGAYCLTQFPDGTILVPDLFSKWIYTYSEDLTLLDSLTIKPEEEDYVMGITYNSKHQTIWVATFTNKAIYETVITDTGLYQTGKGFFTGFNPQNLAYCEDLDAFFISDFNSGQLYAIDEIGQLLPGYPIDFFTSGPFKGISVSGGVLELNTGTNKILQHDQFSHFFPGRDSMVITEELLQGASRINGTCRSLTSPNELFYFVTNPDTLNNISRIYAIDPPDLPQSTLSMIKPQSSPFFSSLPDGNHLELDFKLNVKSLSSGVYYESLAFLTNNPINKKVKIPVKITITQPTSIKEKNNDKEISFDALYPNPSYSNMSLKFYLPSETLVSFEIYNILGQKTQSKSRQEKYNSGYHLVNIDLSSYSSGIYFIQMTAPGFSAIKKFSVIK